MRDDGYDDGEAKYPLPEWCSTNSCGDERCHRCFPRQTCSKHEKCLDSQNEALDLLEELLALTEVVREQIPDTDTEGGYEAWGRISARCADLREGE